MTGTGLDVDRPCPGRQGPLAFPPPWLVPRPPGCSQAPRRGRWQSGLLSACARKLTLARNSDVLPCFIGLKLLVSESAAVESPEQLRLAALQRLKLLDTPASESFDRITRMASRMFDLPIAAVSLTDADRQ